MLIERISHVIGGILVGLVVIGGERGRRDLRGAPCLNTVTQQRCGSHPLTDATLRRQEESREKRRREEAGNVSRRMLVGASSSEQRPRPYRCCLLGNIGDYRNACVKAFVSTLVEPKVNGFWALLNQQLGVVPNHGWFPFGFPYAACRGGGCPPFCEIPCWAYSPFGGPKRREERTRSEERV